jgi:hypothetical protein
VDECGDLVPTEMRSPSRPLCSDSLYRLRYAGSYNNNNNNNNNNNVIPVIIGATGTISKSFRKYVSNIARKHEVKELHKTAILGTAHILRKVLV